MVSRQRRVRSSFGTNSQTSHNAAGQARGESLRCAVDDAVDPLSLAGRLDFDGRLYGSTRHGAGPCEAQINGMSELARHARTTDIDEDSTSETEAEFLREQRESARAFDPELTRLVRFINAADSAEIGLTLHVKGCLVSGLLISAAQYYRLLVKEFTDLDKLSEQSNREVAASFAQSYRPPLDIAEKDVEDSRARKKLPELPCHIHFRQAQTILSGREPFTQSLWRGRLAEVDGWSIGNFGPIPPLNRGLSL